MDRLTLPKNARIHLRSELQELFASRESFVSYPFRVIYLEQQRVATSLKMMVSVPKKKIRHAVDRNRVKRLTREAFRTHCLELKEVLPDDKALLIGFIYIGNEVKSYSTTTRGVTEALRKITSKYTTSDESN